MRARLLALPLLVACGPIDDAGEDAADARPNVLLISIDSLRADHLGCYGYERPTSPSIDALAARGVRFEDVVASTSWTLPSHASLFTALPDSVHGADRSSRALPPDRLTLAERLQEEGYRTAGFWSGPYLHPLFGLGQGFDDYVGCTANEYFARDETLFRGGAPKDQGDANRQSHADVTSPRVLAEVERWLDGSHAEQEPFFLFVHLWDVHYDFIPPPPYDTAFDPDYTGPVDGRNLGEDRSTVQDLSPRDLQHLIALYDGEIAWADHHVGLLLERVEAATDRETVVVLTSDHGEEFFEHGRFGHRKTLYEESIRVPLVIAGSSRIPAGATVAEPVSLLDVAPTVLDLAGAAALPDTYGRSLLPLLSRPAESSTEASATISELRLLRRDEEWLAVRTPEWKVLVERETGRTLKVFNLRADPKEERDLIAEGILIPGELRTLADDTLELLERLARRHAGSGPVDSELTPELEDDLGKLGYLGDDDPDEDP